MTKELELKIDYLVKKWTEYKSTTDERKKNIVTHFVENSLDLAMQQHLKDNKDTNASCTYTYHFIMNEIPDTTSKHAIDVLCSIAEKTGLVNPPSYAISDDLFENVEKKVNKMIIQNEIMEESK